MIFETFILSFFIGKLRGGKIKNLENLYIRGWYFILLSLIIQTITLIVVIRLNNNIRQLIIDKFFILQIIMSILLILGLGMNYKELGFRVTTTGALLNFLPLLFNQGRMPVSLNALSKAKLFNQIGLLNNSQILTHKLMTDSCKLKFLGDIIPISIPFPKVISLGDIILATGLFMVILKYMKLNGTEN